MDDSSHEEDYGDELVITPPEGSCKVRNDANGSGHHQRGVVRRTCHGSMPSQMNMDKGLKGKMRLPSSNQTGQGLPHYEM